MQRQSTAFLVIHICYYFERTVISSSLFGSYPLIWWIQRIFDLFRRCYKSLFTKLKSGSDIPSTKAQREETSGTPTFSFCSIWQKQTYQIDTKWVISITFQARRLTQRYSLLCKNVSWWRSRRSYSMGKRRNYKTHGWGREAVLTYNSAYKIICNHKNNRRIQGWLVIIVLQTFFVEFSRLNFPKMHGATLSLKISTSFRDRKNGKEEISKH